MRQFSRNCSPASNKSEGRILLLLVLLLLLPRSAIEILPPSSTELGENVTKRAVINSELGILNYDGDKGLKNENKSGGGMFCSGNTGTDSVPWMENNPGLPLLERLPS